MLTKVALGVVVCIFAIGAILFWLADPLYLKAPKDRELIKVFQDHRAAFEQLRQMATEDSMGIFSESDLDAGLGDKRRQEYKSLLSEIRPGVLVAKDYDGRTRFIFAEGALLAIGPEWIKGIEYVPGSTAREGDVLKNLDQPASLPWGDVYLRQIEPKVAIFISEN